MTDDALATSQGDGDRLSDLTACDREPIHIPGSIQPHGVLLCLDPDLNLIQASANADRLLGRPLDDVLNRPILDYLTSDLSVLVRSLKGQAIPSGSILPLGELRLAGGSGVYDVVAHRSGEALVIECESRNPHTADAFGSLHRVIGTFTAGMGESVADVANQAARAVRVLTGVDRVLVYRFDEAWNGTVIAEDGNGHLPSYLGLRFPASDIPRQARELYRSNRQRHIPDANYRPIPLVPQANPMTGAPLDLTNSVLRSVSPVHLEYMRNMGTSASMSVSLLQDGRLWGLISCHNAAPAHVPLRARAACEVVAQLAEVQIAAREHATDAGRRITLKTIEARLLARMAAADHFVDGLAEGLPDLLQLTDAAGAAVLHENRCLLLGETPPEPVVRELVDWLMPRIGSEGLFHTDSLIEHLPATVGMKDVAAGLLAVSVSQLHPSFVLWFRPELVRTVVWGGEPRKADGQGAAVGQVEKGRIHPRRSFEAWKETVHLRSTPWGAAEVNAARDLRAAIVDIVLRKAEELAELANELKRSNRELEAFSYSVSHDLRAPFRHIVGYAELLREYEGERLSERGMRFLGTIVESALSAGRLVDDLLGLSRVGRARLELTRVDMETLVHEVMRILQRDIAEGRRVEWRIGPLGTVWGDPVLLRLAVENLLSNALKFSAPREVAIIGMTREDSETEAVFRVTDNGVGFEMAYAHKLFGVFQRLHRADEFEGTGIGLANVRRAIERHGGRTWAEAVLDGGATFFFTLPFVQPGSRRMADETGSPDHG